MLFLVLNFASTRNPYSYKTVSQQAAINSASCVVQDVEHTLHCIATRARGMSKVYAVKYLSSLNGIFYQYGCKAKRS